MPATVTKIVNCNGGGDYTSLNAALAGGWDGAGNRDLVASDKLLIIKCRRGGGPTDTISAAMSGYNTDATRYVRMEGDVTTGDNATPAWSDAKYTLAGNEMLTTQNYQSFVVEGIQLGHTYGYGTCLSVTTGWAGTGPKSEIRNCFFRQVNPSASSFDSGSLLNTANNNPQALFVIGCILDGYRMMSGG